MFLPIDAKRINTLAKKIRIRKDIIYSASLVLNQEKTNELANQLNPYENIIEWGIKYLDPLANSFFFVNALKETKEILLYKQGTKILARDLYNKQSPWFILANEYDTHELNQHRIKLLGSFWFDLKDIQIVCTLDMYNLINP